MRLSSYYLKWIMGVACAYVALFVAAATIESPYITDSWLFGPFAEIPHTRPWWIIVLAIVAASIVLGLVYGWICKKIYQGIRQRIRQRRS